MYFTSKAVEGPMTEYQWCEQYESDTLYLACLRLLISGDVSIHRTHITKPVVSVTKTWCIVRGIVYSTAISHRHFQK